MEDSTVNSRPYRWGKFQGIVLILMGLPGLVFGGVGVHDWQVVSLEVIFAGTGLCLFWKMKGGIVLLIYLCLFIIWHLISNGGYPQASLGILVFFATPCLFYYSKRWNELSWSGANRRKPTKQEEAPKQATLLSDLGKHLVAIGTPQKTVLIYLTWEIDVLHVVSEGRYCTTRVQPMDGNLYCATFDFDNSILTDLMQAATERTQDFIAERLIDDPFSIRSMVLPDPINTGISAVLGNVQQGLHDLFIPLIITEVIRVDKNSTTTES